MSEKRTAQAFEANSLINRGANTSKPRASVHDSLDLFGEVVTPKGDGILKQRFLLPPFSVLSARDGDWQERKRAWLGLGIKSELGRGDVMPSGANSVYSGSSEWSQYRGPVRGAAPGGSLMPAMDYSSGSRGTGKGERVDLAEIGITGSLKEGEAAEQAISGTSIFDPVLCELAYKWFSPRHGVVLDPFAGGSVRGIIASHMERHYFGVDLSGQQIEANRAQLDIAGDPHPTWIEGDSRDIATLVGHNWPGADLVFSCPPYADLEVYSDDPRDLSAVDYEGFKAGYAFIIKQAVALMKPDSFAVFVIGDARGKDGFYYGLPALTIAAFEAAGARLYNEAVLVTAVGSLPVRINGQFNAGRKLGKTHQNILGFCKGDWRRAADKCNRLSQTQTGTVEMNQRAEFLMREVRQCLASAVEAEAQGNEELALVCEAIGANKLAVVVRITEPAKEAA